MYYCCCSIHRSAAGHYIHLLKYVKRIDHSGNHNKKGYRAKHWYCYSENLLQIAGSVYGCRFIKIRRDVIQPGQI